MLEIKLQFNQGVHTHENIQIHFGIVTVKREKRQTTTNVFLLVHIYLFL